MNNLRQYIDILDEANQQLDEVSRNDKAEIDAKVDTIGSGSTYADVEKIYNSLPGKFWHGHRNYFLGKVAQKLGVVGMYKPDSATLGGIVTTKPDENSTRFAETGTAFGLGMKEKDVKKLAELNMLPPKRLEKAKEKYPDWEIWGGMTGAKTGDAQIDGAPQSNDELDADAADNATPNEDPYKLVLSDGSTFTNDSRSKRNLDTKAGQLVRRLDELIRKMNESIPNSLKGMLTESDQAIILIEALSNSEMEELLKIFDDLNKIANFQDPNMGDNEYLISRFDRTNLLRRLNQYQPVIDRVKEMRSADSDDKADDKADDEVDPEAQKASDDSNDKGADDSKDDDTPSGDLEAFAKSGKGGLANDPEEVDAIKELQQFLTDLGFDTKGADGTYGSNTISAVKEFQEYTGAKVDGDAGPETIGMIVKLRSIKYGNNKSFADFRRAMTRMEELVKKSGTGGTTSSGQTDGSAINANDPDLQSGGAIGSNNVSAESANVNIRDMINLVERMLTEALSDAEKQELQTLYNELKPAYDDPEWNQVLPKPAQKRFADIMKDAKQALDGNADTGDFENGDEIPAEYLDADGNPDWDKIPPEITYGTIDGVGVERPPEDDEEPTSGPDDGTRGEAAYKEVTGSGQSKRYKVFDKDGNELRNGRGAGPTNLPTKEEWEAQQGSEDPGSQDSEDEVGPPAYKEVTGSGQMKRYTVYDDDGNEISSGEGVGPNLPIRSKPKDDDSAADSANADDPEATGGGASSYVSGDFLDVDTFYKSDMSKAEAEALVGALQLQGADMNQLMDLQNDFDRVISVLNGNQRVPDSAGEPNGGKIVNKSEAAEVLKSFKRGQLMDALRNSMNPSDDNSAADSANADDPEATGGDTNATTGSDATARAFAYNDQIIAMANDPNADTADVQALAKKIIADADAFALFPANMKSNIRLLAQ